MRVHLFEIEDLQWCPKFIRESTTDFLLSLCNAFNLYEPAFQKITEVLQETGVNHIVDCCSGSGGTILHLRKHLDNSHYHATQITMTDKFPNIEAFQKINSQYAHRKTGSVQAHEQSIDATALPLSMPGMRTFFSSFHHFDPKSAIKILQDAVNKNAPIGIFECTQRHPADFVKTLLSPILMLVLMPMAKRMNWKKFIFTYLIPITLLTNMWDYFVSNLRTYSQKELHALIKEINAPHYHWEVGRLWSKKAMSHLPYLIGYPKKTN